MNRTYEDMSKEELITLVTRLAKQHDEWSDEAKELREQVEYFKGLVDHYKDELLKAMEMSDEAKRLREGRLDLINEVVRLINNKTGERVDADLHDYIIDRLVNE